MNHLPNFEAVIYKIRVLIILYLFNPRPIHMQEELHVEVTAHAPPAEAYARIAYALTEIRRYLVPVRAAYKVVRAGVRVMRAGDRG